LEFSVELGEREYFVELHNFCTLILSHLRRISDKNLGH